MALLASLVAADGYARLGAEERFLELQCQIFAKIGTALHPAATTSTAATTAEHVTEAKELSEDVAEVLKDRGIEAGRLPRAPEPCMAIAVVYGALVCVGEHGIGFADFLEFFFRVGIVGIAVRMELQGQFAVGALEFDLGDRAGHAQHFIVIAFCVRRQK
jgi:hypothetical protein